MSAPVSHAPLPVIVVGGSAGAFEPLLELLRGLGEERSAAICVVLHIPAQGGRALVNVIKRATSLPAEYAVAGERLAPGRVYIAPPDQHLSIKDGHVHVHRGPRENHCRPAIDPLFRSAARYHGRHVLGILLSGALDDGTAGFLAIKRRGGLTVVQDPEEAAHPSMPRSAVANVDVDQVLRVSTMASFVRTTLAEQRAHPHAVTDPPDPPVDALVEDETDQQEESPSHVRAVPPGHPSPFSCPECGGVLFERSDVATPHFRCRTGHAYSPGTLAALQGTVYEDALWAGLRSLRERVALARRMAERATATGRVHSAAILAQRIVLLEKHAATLEELLERSSHEAQHEDSEE